MSLSSFHIIYNHTPTALLKPYTEPLCGLLIFQCPEVVLTSGCESAVFWVHSMDGSEYRREDTGT